jgi:hypothetical protein
MFDTPMFAFLLLGATGLYLRQRSSFGLAGKAGFYLTAFGFSLGVVGGAMIIVIGLTVSDEATLGIPDLIAHMLSHVFYAVGSILLGIATYRVGILPKAAAVMMSIVRTAYRRDALSIPTFMTLGSVGEGAMANVPAPPETSSSSMRKVSSPSRT